MTEDVITKVSVCVEHWSRVRLVENRGDKVAMEIARMSCSHCATCSKRMETVTDRVNRAGLDVEWERIEGGYFIVTPLPDGENPIEHLRSVPNLRIEVLNQRC